MTIALCTIGPWPHMRPLDDQIPFYADQGRHGMEEAPLGCGRRIDLIRDRTQMDFADFQIPGDPDPMRPAEPVELPDYGRIAQPSLISPLSQPRPIGPRPADLIGIDPITAGLLDSFALQLEV